MLLLCATGAAESAQSQTSAVRILSSRSGEKLKLSLNPRPPGKVEVRVTLVDPAGNKSPLPPKATSCEPNYSICYGPEMPPEARGSLITVEVFDPATGASLGIAASWTG
ncbi:MAG: hypothetical protein JNM84_06940 [Planctomycetes bacterium]|nr:hypothetical protein [Planctomycetota bacterium]